MSEESLEWIDTGDKLKIGTSDPRAARFRLEQRQALQRDQLVSALAVSETVDYGQISTCITRSFGKKSPISVLMEHAQYAKSKVNFVEVGQPDGPDHKPMFTMVAVVNGHPYMRVRAGCKRDCRTGAAYLAWKAIIHEQQTMYRQMIADRSVSDDDRIAALSHLEYLAQVELNPLAFSGRRVLATVLVKSDRNEYRVVSLGTGNRCILSNYLSLDGTTVHDSHAEVIARRALLKYLYSEILSFKAGDRNTILERSKAAGGNRLSVKPGFTFHLYVSASPCGDASLFSREGLKAPGSEFVMEMEAGSLDIDDEHQPIYSSAVQGVLRTKIEAGEGSIPIERKCLQTWIGLQFGNRLRTMCCSDKILKWNVVGLQGALLTHIMDPIYLSSVTVGDPFVHGHVTRALYHRLARSDVELDLPAPFRLVCPNIGHSKVGRCSPETEKSTAVTMVWYCGMERAEVIDGTTGMLCDDMMPENMKSLPLVCKKSIYTDFHEVFGSNSSVSSNSNVPSSSASTYYSAKQSARLYQQGKTTLYSALSTLGYGDWIKKPIEVDYFV